VIVSAHNGYPRWVDSGADFIEVDIRRSRRGVIVLAHDPLRWWRRYASLDEVLGRVTPQTGLHLDLKEAGYEDDLLRQVLERWSDDRVVVTPGSEASARAIKAGFPRLRVSPVDFATLDQRYATDQALEAARKPVWVWTVDDPAQMKRLMASAHVEGIVTNRPDLALELRSARS
jgi:glycerophosphoryl diester phosphodiesterase